MLWKVEKLFRFEASHVLPKHEGKCARLHGHSWVARVTLEGSALHDGGSQDGMLVDFAVLKRYVAPLVDEYLDHHHLNESTGLENPTSEELARWLFVRIHRVLPPSLADMLSSVTVEETCTSACSFSATTREAASMRLA